MHAEGPANTLTGRNRRGIHHRFRMDDPAVDGYSLRLPDGLRSVPTVPSAPVPPLKRTGGRPRRGSPLPRPPERHPPMPGRVTSTPLRRGLSLCPHLTEGPYEERQWFDRLELLDDILVEVARGYRVDLCEDLPWSGTPRAARGPGDTRAVGPGNSRRSSRSPEYTRPDQGIRKPIVEATGRPSGNSGMDLLQCQRSGGRIQPRSERGRRASRPWTAVPFLVLNHGTVGTGSVPRQRGHRHSRRVRSPGRNRILSVYRIGIHSEGRIWDNPVLYEWLLGHSNPDYRTRRPASRELLGGTVIP
ncbi:MAG: hypothetical protein MZU95_08670 [Desulfomicrobium escambiense]|nr:hypothetical protein [Desulfomicrobium escambiense]